MDAKFLKKEIKEELQEVQKYLDDGYWDYDDKTDEQLGYVNIKAEEFIARIEDFRILQQRTTLLIPHV